MCQQIFFIFVFSLKFIIKLQNIFILDYVGKKFFCNCHGKFSPCGGSYYFSKIMIFWKTKIWNKFWKITYLNINKKNCAFLLNIYPLTLQHQLHTYLTQTFFFFRYAKKKNKINLNLWDLKENKLLYIFWHQAALLQHNKIKYKKKTPQNSFTYFKAFQLNTFYQK